MMQVANLSSTFLRNTDNPQRLRSSQARLLTSEKVLDKQEGMVRSENLLDALVDRKTVLFLSGGSTPKDLYAKIAKDQKLTPGAVAMVDERYGKRFHENSNELMIKNTGLILYLEKKNIRFYPILEDQTGEKTTENYDETVRFLLSFFPKSVAIIGIGADGHTAGIAPDRIDFKNPLFDKDRKDLLVSQFNDAEGEFKERITMTFLALSMIDKLIVLAFGDKKKRALELMNKGGSIEEVPARFLVRSDIVQKTLLITDQKI